MDASSAQEYHVAIVGGGITGLSAAYYLQKSAESSGKKICYTLLESADRLGGKVRTDTVETDPGLSFVVEGGPDSFISQKPWAYDLAVELGIAHRVTGTNDDLRKVYVLNKGRPTELPDGVLLIVPTKFTPFALSPLISPLGKMRMGMELFIPAKQDDEDETLAQFITRRLGNEALDKIAEPLMSGIYNAEADKQSVMATFPRFRAMEKKYGSLIKGMLASRRARAASPQSQNGYDARPKSAFVTLLGGTQELTDTIITQLTGDLRVGNTVSSIERTQDGRFRLSIGGSDQALFADQVLLTTPTYVTSQLVRSLAPESAELLDNIRYVSTGTISLAYKADELDDVIDGFGLVIPMSEERPINAVTFSSTKFSNRAPDGYRLLRVFFGGSRSPKSMQLTDDELERTVRIQLRELLGIEASPLFHRIYRWRRSNPQYDIGHLERIEAIESQLPPGIYVAGSAYRGVGLPDCVHQAQLAVEKILEEEAMVAPVAVV